ncbi:MAG: OPT/YSL family transporter [Phycisphaerales bacterium]|nr:OPT/YSL family transporter [Phycisphaerales bacterium]
MNVDPYSSSNPPSPANRIEMEGETGAAGLGRPGSVDDFDPSQIPVLPDGATPEERDEHWYRYVYQGDRMPQLTVRAVAMGAFLGMGMSIAHIYTALKIGWGFGIAITACVLSYVIWNGLRALSGKRLGQMSMLENACMASTASAAGYSTGSTVATAVGAHLLITGEHLPWQSLTGFVFFAAALGVFWAIPMKRQMINVEQLAFPSGVAAAETLKSLYTHGAAAMRKAYALVAMLGVGAFIGILRAPENAMSWLDRILNSTLRLPDKLWFQPAGTPANPRYNGLSFEPSGLLIAAGMLVGPRVAYSLLAGSCFLYFFMAPWLENLDAREAAAAAAAGTTYVRQVELTAGGTMFQVVRWSLWGGTATMVMASLTSLALSWKTIARSFNVFKGRKAGLSAAESLEVPATWLIIGLIPIGIGMVLVQYFAFQIEIWLGIIAVALSFVISLVCSRATGETDTTPTGAMGKVTQAVFAVLSPGNITHNLMSAGATSSSGLAAADLLTDLKTGYVIGANPRKQFWAQFIGVFFGTIITIPGWYLLVPDKAALEKFDPPATKIWAAVAEALTKGLSSIPSTAQAAIVIGAILGVSLTLIEKLFPKAKKYLPSVTGLGFSWVMNFYNCFAFAIGATITLVWGMLDKRSRDGYNVPIASGLIAGESLMAALIAILITIYQMAQR